MIDPDEEPKSLPREIQEVKETLEKALEQVKHIERQEKSVTDATEPAGDPTTDAPITWSIPDDED